MVQRWPWNRCRHFRRGCVLHPAWDIVASRRSHVSPRRSRRGPTRARPGRAAAVTRTEAIQPDEAAVDSPTVRQRSDRRGRDLHLRQVRQPRTSCIRHRPSCRASASPKAERPPRLSHYDCRVQHTGAASDASFEVAFVTNSRRPWRRQPSRAAAEDLQTRRLPGADRRVDAGHHRRAPDPCPRLSDGHQARRSPAPSRVARPATTAQVHKSPTRGMRGRVVSTLPSRRTRIRPTGTIAGTLDLTPALLADLKRPALRAAAQRESPDGNLWGWLLPLEKGR